ncbi:hypothetical protein BKA70DRAFT_169931 [Coprinopsis sp. MPI-PUGE-AT-0042]|nr:hypothetical protein BKA70DRAFT_169931 [Coprinopsis sp. MPI-PUGE-AT-0042]
MACSLDLDDIIASSPPELAPYVSSNNILPSYLSSYLDAYLLKLFQTMKRLESEITASPLEELPIFKMQDYQKVKEAYNTHVRIKAPIRRIPQDVLGVIFPYAIDIPPFNTYSDVARIRSVCSSWRHVARTTPGLWTSLTIHLDKWCGEELDDLDSDALLRHFKEALAPWTSILSKTIPYQLILTSNKRKRKSHWPVYNQISHRNLLVEYLFHSTPGPNIVTIDSWSALCGALASHSSSTRTVKVHTIGLWNSLTSDWILPSPTSRSSPAMDPLTAFLFRWGIHRWQSPLGSCRDKPLNPSRI